MAAVKSRDTKPEMLVRSFLHRAGFRFTLNNKKYPGSPDIVLPRLHTAIFVNGCFWHGHENCKYFHLPTSNSEFWKNKINRNIERDRKATAALEDMDWVVIVIWGCELKTKERREATLKALVSRLKDLQNWTNGGTHYLISGEEDPGFMTAAEPERNLKRIIK